MLDGQRSAQAANLLRDTSISLGDMEAAPRGSFLLKKIKSRTSTASILRRQFCSPLYFAAGQLVNASTVNFPHTWISFCYVNLPPSEALATTPPQFLSFLPICALETSPSASHPALRLPPPLCKHIYLVPFILYTNLQINGWVNAFCQACLQLTELLLCCFIHPRWQTPQHLHTTLVLGREMGKR